MKELDLDISELEFFGKSDLNKEAKELKAKKTDPEFIMYPQRGECRINSPLCKMLWGAELKPQHYYFKFVFAKNRLFIQDSTLADDGMGVKMTNGKGCKQISNKPIIAKIMDLLGISDKPYHINMPILEAYKFQGKIIAEIDIVNYVVEKLPTIKKKLDEASRKDKAIIKKVIQARAEEKKPELESLSDKLARLKEAEADKVPLQLDARTTIMVKPNDPRLTAKKKIAVDLIDC